MRVAIFDAPFDYVAMLGDLRNQVELVRTLSKEQQEDFTFIHFFATEYAELVNTFPALKRALHKKGQLWISWPKRGASVATDLNENMIREVGLENGLVDVKVAAIDENWSGLKFVFRLKDR